MAWGNDDYSDGMFIIQTRPSGAIVAASMAVHAQEFEDFMPEHKTSRGL